MIRIGLLLASVVLISACSADPLICAKDETKLLTHVDLKHCNQIIPLSYSENGFWKNTDPFEPRCDIYILQAKTQTGQNLKVENYRATQSHDSVSYLVVPTQDQIDLKSVYISSSKKSDTCQTLFKRHLSIRQNSDVLDPL